MKLCSIASGSSGNCIFVGSDSSSLLIDAGISGKRVEAGLKTIDRSPRELDGILVTHEHSDHIQGLGVLARKYGIPIYTTRGTAQAILEAGKIGKLPEGIFREVREDEFFTVGDLSVQPFRISHDAAQPVGFRVHHAGRAVAVATDMGIYDDYIVENLKGVNALLLEANHDERMLQAGSYPYYLKRRIAGNRGHLSNTTAGQLLCRILGDQLHTILLGHLSRENNYEALAYETVCAEVTMGNTPYKSGDFHIAVAKRDCISELISV